MQFQHLYEVKQQQRPSVPAKKGAYESFSLVHAAINDPVAAQGSYVVEGSPYLAEGGSYIAGGSYVVEGSYFQPVQVLEADFLLGAGGMRPTLLPAPTAYLHDPRKPGKRLADAASMPDPLAREVVDVEEARRNADAIALLEGWLKEEATDEDRADWERVKAGMDEHRGTGRKLFR